MNCLIFGDQTLSVQCAEILLAKGHLVAGIVTSFAAFRDWAVKRGLPHISPDGDLIAFARQIRYNCVFSIVNGTIIPDEILNQAGGLAINFHDGPLPKSAGFNVTNWAILNGETQHGITWHEMQARLDAGAIHHQVLFEIAPAETAFTLNAKCYEAALNSFPALVDGIAGLQAQPRPQDLTGRTYIPRYRRPSGWCTLDWQQPAAQIDALCRALDFGPYPNPMGLPKFWDGRNLIGFASLEIAPAGATGRPGEFVLLAGGDLQVGTATTPVILRAPRRVSGVAWVPESAQGILPPLDHAVGERMTELHSASAKHESFWIQSLLRAQPLTLGIDLERFAAPPLPRSLTIEPPFANPPALPVVVAAYLAFWMRSTGSHSFQIGYQDAEAARQLHGLPAMATALQPLAWSAQPDMTLEQLKDKAAAVLEGLQKHGPLLLDLADRYPELRAAGLHPARAASAVGIQIVPEDLSELPATLPGRALTLVVSRSGANWRLVYDANLIPEGQAQLWASRITHALRAAADNPALTVAGLPVMSGEERQLLTHGWNQTGKPYDTSACIHDHFERQVMLRPDATALVFENESLSYSELNFRANQVAHHLRSLGAGPNQLVGVYMERSIHLVVALLGVLKSGAAYVPIDSAFPAQRRALILEDAQAKVVLTQRNLAEEIDPVATQIVCLDENGAFLQCSGTNPPRLAQPSDLAYVIHTSGSTGKPKGVEITHRNVINFFAGMDDLNGSDPGVWLAVTSVSFDISVFELFWTLARGFKIVLASEEHRALVSRQSPALAENKPPAFSLFYFSSDQSASGMGGKYDLLLEGARFADKHGFLAVWTPERHFHAFGGLYPNPSVTSAAVAAITKSVRIRSGSVVLPLHHPVRVAEEWSVVDNLSGGRVDISFASGWHARDFLLAPQNYARAKDVMFESVDVVRRLWRGESVSYPDGQGNPAEVAILPRPVQNELPVWITAAGNPETFRLAGERGFNILTHLLGQRFEDVEKKIRIYREARAAAGFDPATGQVTLMLHTFVANSTDEAREAVRGPLKQYLRSSVDLIKKSPWSFPAFTNKPNLNDVPSLDLSTLNEEEMDILLDHSFERYFETSGMFGTVEECVAVAERVRRMGVTEIACLIDFGVESNRAFKALPLLAEVRRRTTASARAGDFSLPAQMEVHGVTHMQSTPSLAKMLLANSDSSEALGRLKRYFVGGEALPQNLAGQLRQTVRGEVHNMYGPTETTVWSSTAPVNGEVVIGRPIANTAIYILDEALEPVPTCLTGEIYIGGEGVARGYWGQPELTASRFVADPFRPGTRMYRTGDLGRYRLDGNIEFLGRGDHQVKIRGHRIELGEIETTLQQHPAVRDCVITASQMESATTLLAYYTPAGDATELDLRTWLRQRLPEYMLPAQFIRLDAIPLTPNGKVDRRALPAPSSQPAAGGESSLNSANDFERDIARIWREELNRADVGLDDNFFDLGGHSILVVQVHTKLKSLLNRDVSLVDIFRFPTIRGLAKHLGGNSADSDSLVESSSRASLRRDLMSSRRAGRRPA